MKKPYVAIVDDDSAFSNYLRTFLSLRGYETRSYSRGDELLASVKQGDPPDIVLLDVMMPGMNGLETLRALKAAKPDMQAIMLSGREHASTIVEAVRLGAADYVVKPDDPDALAEALAMLWADRGMAVRLGQQAFAGVRAHYTIQQSAARLLDVYQAVVEPGTAGRHGEMHTQRPRGTEKT